jgi:nondiscriminating glutamyl-tRNA synthetase
VTNQVRVRIAPSPTGNLHVGTARTALYNYLYAKRHKGTFILRLEDTDAERSDEAYTRDIVDGLRWLGLNWDEGLDVGGPYEPYRQTQKIDHYETVANHLISKGVAYLCYATPEELSVLKEEQKATGQAPRYDNRGRNLADADRKYFEEQGRVPSIRFIVDEPRMITWQDQIKGEIAIDSTDLGGDMVIVKSNGVAIYNFAVVVDDIDMHMTHVIRGEDHIHNTAKQLLIYEALDKNPPFFAHAPLIFDLERQKLSKRKHGETVHVDYYRTQGYMPEAIVNYLAHMSWTHPEGKEIYDLEEAASLFDLDKISKSSAVFDAPKLQWFNSHYLRSLPIELIVERAKPFLTAYDTSKYTSSDLALIIASVRDGLTTLAEVAAHVNFFFHTKVEVPDDVRTTVLANDNARKVLTKVLENLSTIPWSEHQGCKKAVDGLGKELGLKGKDLYWPVRAALSGRTHGPDLGAIISILGEGRVRARLEAALGLCKSC